MKTLDWSKLHKVISEFLQKHGSAYDTLEFWLDTSSAKLAKQPTSMYLVFYGFTNHTDFDSVMKKVQQNDDMSLLEDNVQASSEQTWFELAQVDQELSTGAGFVSNSGVDKIVSEITSLVRKDPESYAAFSRIFLHWVDNTEIKWIKKDP